ncbi:MAG: DAK2 domain-containing protein [Planctomycetota bacterium]
MPKNTLSKDEVKAMLLLACDRIIAAEPQLSEADRNLGDGDHGLGMQRGMTAAKEKLNSGDAESVEKAFSSVGMAMMSSMGGASGAIIGASSGANEPCGGPEGGQKRYLQRLRDPINPPFTPR